MKELFAKKLAMSEMQSISEHTQKSLISDECVGFASLKSTDKK